MSHGDDDDDQQLKSLRAVWLDMPDEDPPERGLADLLAAARTKAAEMKAPAPTMWQRVSALLRRPPMLALATVTILVGGFVLIGRHDEKAAAPAVSAPPGGEATSTKSELAAPQSPPPPAPREETVQQFRDEKVAPHQRALAGAREPEDDIAVQRAGKANAVMLDAGVAPIEKTGAATAAEPAQ